jgi:hypothetical protein
MLVLLLAILPQVLYLGNPAAGADTTASNHRAHHDEAAAEHANHCHVGPKSCAGAEGAVIAPGSSMIAALPFDGMSHTLDSTPVRNVYSVWQRPDKPPRPV